MLLRRGLHPRYKIKALSKQLRKLSFPTSPISVDLAKFAADAFDKFLTGTCTSLDKAFGLVKGPGAPRHLQTAKKNRAFAKKIDALRLKGNTWEQCEEVLGLDQRALRRIYKPFRAEFGSRRIIQMLKTPE